MVFVNESWNGTGEIVVYSNYHKYWQNRELHIKNPLFDVYSGKILDLKEGRPSAINYFYNIINDEICDGVTICVVPSSNSEKTTTGIGLLAEKLARNNRIDKVYFLLRHTSIEKLATGGIRSKDIHLRTIQTATILISQEISFFSWMM